MLSSCLDFSQGLLLALAQEPGLVAALEANKSPAGFGMKQEFTPVGLQCTGGCKKNPTRTGKIQ